MADPYSILGVSKTANAKEVKSAFRKLAKKYHPDQNKDNPQAKDRFAELNSAYEILGDKDKKGQFDRGEIDAEGKPLHPGFEGFSQNGMGGNPFGGFSHQAGPGGAQRGGVHMRGAQMGGGMGDAEDILSQIFGGMQGGPQYAQQGGFGGQDPRPRGPQKAPDIKVTARVTLEEVAAEKTKVQLAFNRKVAVSIPPGVEDGQVIRLKGQGEKGQVPGDALVTIAIRPHKTFERKGANLRADVPVQLHEAVLGGSIRVPTLSGAVSLKIPAWSSSSSVFRLKGKGLPQKDGSRGDLLAEIKIMLPEGGDEQLAKLMQERVESAAKA